MEYFVRTSHIVAGIIYVICLFSLLGIFFGGETKITPFGEKMLLGSVAILVPVFVISCIHYIVLKRFHPWAKMPDKEEEQTD